MPEYEVFSFLRMFDSELQEDEIEISYMERKYQIVGNLPFCPDDLPRIIVLSSLDGRPFLDDFPNYSGQVTFSNE